VTSPPSHYSHHPIQSPCVQHLGETNIAAFQSPLALAPACRTIAVLGTQHYGINGHGERVYVAACSSGI
jgi:hypothetical protein